MVLRVFDVSNIIRTGLTNKVATIMGGVRNTPKGYKAIEIKSGGLSLLFRMIRKYKDDYLVFCCDRPPTEKRKIYPSYKESKCNTPIGGDFDKQIRVVEEILQQCGFNVLFREGYEADDIIYSVIKKYHDDFDNIVVHTKDTDLCLVVDNKVSIGPVGNNGREVNRDNYELSVTKKRITPYNTVALHKILHGDTSDNVEGVSKSTAKKIENIIYSSNVLPSLCSSYNFLYNFFKKEAPELLTQLRVIFPFEIDIDIDMNMRPDDQLINAWGYLVNCGDYTQPPKNEKELIDSIIEYF